MLLKGSTPAILTVSGSGSAAVEVEWLRSKSSDAIWVFRSETDAEQVSDGRCRFPADQIRAAAISSDLNTRGQFGSFDWAKAGETLRIKACSCNKLPINNAVFETPGPVLPKDDPPAPPPCEPIKPTAKPPARPPSCPCRLNSEPQKVVPFPREFPESDWLRHDYPSANGGWHYLTGTIRKGGVTVATATAVPGRYGAKPPVWLREFSHFLQSAENHQGYWVAVSPYHANSTISEET